MTKEKLSVLDGMRGLAAILVVLRHTGHMWNISFFRSYLAVDLFFILSGFVIAHAYDRRLANGLMTSGRFVAIRLIRLYPIYLLSILLCIFLITADIFLGKGYDAHKTPLLYAAAFLALLYIPFPFRIEGDMVLFPVNFPAWSLFYELIANFAYALFYRRLTERVLMLFVAFCGALLIYCSFKNGGLDGGYYWHLRSLATGTFRSFFGIFLGILIYRKQGIFQNLQGVFLTRFLPLVLICLVLLSPAAGGFNWIVDWICVATVFPLAVLLASRSVSGPFERTFLLLGSASYPIYVFHEPAMEAISYLVTAETFRSISPFGGIAFLIALIGISVVLERIFDIPVRKAISRRLFGQRDFSEKSGSVTKVATSEIAAK